MRSDLKVIARAFWNLVAAADAVTVLDESLHADGSARARHQKPSRRGLIPPNDVLTAEAQLSRERMLRIEAAGVETWRKRRSSVSPAFHRERRSGPFCPTRHHRRPNASTISWPPLALNRSDRKALADRVAAPQRAATRQARQASHGRRWRRLRIMRAPIPHLSAEAGMGYVMGRQPELERRFSMRAHVGRDRRSCGEHAGRGGAAGRVRHELTLEIRQRLTGRPAAPPGRRRRHTIRVATEARRVVNERFAAGVATSTDVLDAQTDIVRGPRSHAGHRQA